MSIWNKILIGLIVVASLAFFYLSARMLKTHKYWGDLADKYETAIRNLRKENKNLKEGEKSGDELKPGIEQVRAELDKLITNRHRVWYNCTPTVDINKQTGALSIKVTVDQPDPPGIRDRMILEVFEEAGVRQQGRYLGEFKVRSVADKQVSLEPAVKLLPRDVEKLSTAKRLWTMYDTMPADNHEIFAQWKDEDKKAMLPAETVEQYIKNGQAAAEEEPAEHKAEGKYVRPLRDYAVLFGAYRLKITVLIDLEQAAMRDLQLLEDTLADAKRQVQFYQKQVTVFQGIAAKFAHQRDAVKSHLEKLQEKLGAAKEAAEKFFKNNKAMAGQIAKIQLDATRRIDKRTGAMAQSASGEK